MQAVEFWYECIGKLINPSLTPAAAITQSVNTRKLKGTGPNRLGSGIDAFYVASPGESVLIGKLELPNQPGLTFIPSEDRSGERFIAHWLIHKAPENAPWMIGVIGNANPVSSLKVSNPPSLCSFCRSGSNFDFDLSLARQAINIIGDLDWKKEVAPALHTYQTRLHAIDAGDPDQADREAKKLHKMFEKNPALKRALIDLCKLPIKPGSGEYEILSWYNRVR